MNQKTNKKYNLASHSLFHQLKQALNAEKQNLSLQSQNVLKRTSQNHNTTKKDNPLSCSLHLNDAIMLNLQRPHSLSMALNTSKMSLTPKNLPTPYQTRKSQANSQIAKNLPKKQSFFELRKKVSPQSAKILSVKHQRVQKFFKADRSKTQVVQNEQSLTYSMILKSFTHSENVLQSQKSTIKNPKVTDDSEPKEKCCRCSFHTQERAATFFKNEEIKKNISIIEEMKRAFEQKNNEEEFKHFPEVQVLNLSYFNENKRKIVNKIHSRQGPYSLQKMRLFASRKKISEAQCAKCKDLERQISEQEKEKKISNLITYPNSFQYFVYEYKPTGHSSKKNVRSQKVASQSTLYLKKNRSNTRNINNQKSSSSMNGFNQTFKDFMTHNKIDVPPRPQTAAPKKTSAQFFHYRISHPCPAEPNLHHHHVVQSKKQPNNEENFVKPWQHNGVQVEGDNQF